MLYEADYMKKTFIKKVEQLEKKESKIKIKDIKKIQKEARNKTLRQAELTARNKSGNLYESQRYKDIFFTSSSTKSKSFCVIAFFGKVIDGL